MKTITIGQLVNVQPDVISVCRRLIPVYLSIDVSRIDEGYFSEHDVIIRFDEMDVHNPVYTRVSPTLGQVTVTTSSHFIGQTIVNIGSDGARTVLGSQPLQGVPLSLDAGDVFIADDGDNPTTPVLSGSPIFDGPIAVLFSCNVNAVALTGGYFNAIGSTFIQAFNELGQQVNLVSNSQLGIESFGIRTLNTTADIRGISFYVNADEPAGFAIDNLRFK